MGEGLKRELGFGHVKREIGSPQQTYMYSYRGLHLQPSIIYTCILKQNGKFLQTLRHGFVITRTRQGRLWLKQTIKISAESSVLILYLNMALKGEHFVFDKCHAYKEEGNNLALKGEDLPKHDASRK